MLLGGPMVTGERKSGRWGGAEEGHVHDSLYAGVDGCVDKGEVLLDTFGSLGSGDHEDSLGASERRSSGRAITVVAGSNVGARQGLCPRRIAYYEAMVHAVAFWSLSRITPVSRPTRIARVTTA